MKLQPVIGLPKLNVTPLEKMCIENLRLTIELDDEHENRFTLTSTAYQAIRVVTIDCFSLPTDFGWQPQMITELIDSPWIEELKKESRITDETATFMDRARHFFIPVQDQVIEVVAWDLIKL